MSKLVSLSCGSIIIATSMIIVQLSYSQTYFTVPENVWRCTITGSQENGKWIGKKGVEEVGRYRVSFLDHSDDLFGLESIFISGWLTEMQSRTISSIETKVEYGSSKRVTLAVSVPYINNLEVDQSWRWEPDDLPGLSDSSEVIVDALLGYYHPTLRTSSGLKDVSLAVNILLLGEPAWTAKGFMSIYGGVEMYLPSGRTLGPYRFKSAGRPTQFEEVAVGLGITQWKFSLFGEIYREAWGRLFDITWFTQLGISSREALNTPVSFVGLAYTHPDSIVSKTGTTYLYRRGTDFLGILAAKLDLWPDRLSAEVSMSWYIKGRDEFISDYSAWDSKMIAHVGYDTRAVQSNQTLIIYLNNVEPLKKIGPLPFDLEFGVSTSVFTRNYFRNSNAWVGLITYFQAW